MGSTHIPSFAEDCGEANMIPLSSLDLCQLCCSPVQWDTKYSFIIVLQWQMLSLQNRPVDQKWGLVTTILGRTSLRSPSDPHLIPAAQLKLGSWVMQALKISKPCKDYVYMNYSIALRLSIFYLVLHISSTYPRSIYNWRTRKATRAYGRHEVLTHGSSPLPGLG